MCNVRLSHSSMLEELEVNKNGIYLISPVCSFLFKFAWRRKRQDPQLVQNGTTKLSYPLDPFSLPFLSCQSCALEGFSSSCVTVSHWHFGSSVYSFLCFTPLRGSWSFFHVLLPHRFSHIHRFTQVFLICLTQSTWCRITAMNQQQC